MKKLNLTIILSALMAMMMLVSCATVEPEPIPEPEPEPEPIIVPEIRYWDLVVTGVEEKPLVYRLEEGMHEVPDYTLPGKVLDTIEDLDGKEYEADKKFMLDKDTYLTYTWTDTYKVHIMEKGPGLSKLDTYTVSDLEKFTLPERYHDGIAIDTITDEKGNFYYFGSTLDSSRDEWFILYTWKNLEYEDYWTADQVHSVYSTILGNALTAMEKMRTERNIKEVPVIDLESVVGPVAEFGGVDFLGIFRDILIENGRAWAASEKDAPSESFLATLAESVIDETDRYVFSTDISVERHELADDQWMKIYVVNARLEDPDTGTVVWEGTDDSVKIIYDIPDLDAAKAVENAE